ncbi:MAG: dihydroorotate dehydrogenase electron transfer subunit [Oscillospiraceae bacterium]|nr:dihydroorotate dehydrogenase electron transfer subunit [Oscillospiraceae bacterium]
MSAVKFQAEVLENLCIAPDICRMTVRWPVSAGLPAPHAGQFYMLRSWAFDETPMLSRPISVHDYDAEKETLTFLYQVKREGTEKLKALEAGQSLSLTGPCGNGFDTAEIVRTAAGRPVAVVGGGIGTAPLLLLCRELSAAGCKLELYCGFRDQPYGLEEFLPYCAAVSVATDSGAVGYHGLVTEILHPEQFAAVLTCGPMVMMRGVAKLCDAAGVPCLASLERKMACGLGACLGCTCHTKVGAKTVCKDGPVFPAEEVFE